VYGNQSKVPFSESDPCDRPISPYAASKRAGELLCANYFHLYGLPSACLRFFTVYGPRQRPEMAIGMFCRKILKGEPITLFGDGKTSRDYTYVSDIVQGIIAAMKMPKLGFEIFNLGNSSPITLKALVDLIAKTAKQKSKINWAAMQPGDVERTYADLRKSQKLLRYRPQVSINQGIKLTLSAILPE
jgi:UDP-glucuronate 4-epimerase